VLLTSSRDLLKRHVANHDSNSSNKRQRREITRDTRVVQACEACSSSHLRCEDEKPCTRCRKKNIPCQVPDTMLNEGNELDAVHAAQDLLDLSNGPEFSSPNPMLQRNIHSRNIDSSLTSNMGILESQPPFDPSLSAHPTAAGGSMARPEASGRERHAPGMNSMLPPSPPNDGGLSFYDNALSQLDHTPSIDMFLPDYFRNMTPYESYPPGHATPRGIMDLSFDLDVGLTDMDLGLLDQYNFQAPFAAETPSTDAQELGDQVPEPDGVPVRAEAFKQSIWRYLPQRDRDFGAAEQANLAFSDTDASNNRRSSMTNRRAIAERLDRVSRDRLMALVLGTCSPENARKIASAFPSVELLDGLIQYYLTSPSIDAQSWFHLPTFLPSKTSPELLACIVAAGAAATPDTPLRKLGFALHEASRSSLGRAFEEDNSAIRDLHHLRPVCLQLETGMWSGISRKMEIAESFLQPLVTMLRRGGRFRRSTWRDISPDAGDHGATLTAKWHDWVHQETYLRLVYRTFELDRQSSMALLKPPLISYADMQLPLPSFNVLWQAKSASAWKSAYLELAHQNMKRPSAIDCFLDLSHLAQHEYACTTYLYMVWGLVWEYRQVSTLTGKSQLRANNSLIVSSRYQELNKQLEDFRFTGPPMSKSSEITLELMLLHLNAPLDDMQLFAGIEGQEEARSAYYGLREWIKTVSARQALLHAGQILRAAESLPRALLCNFNAIAVYHAGLVLWGFGFLRRTTQADQASSGVPQPIVVLNGDDALATRRFITLDRGAPSIRIAGTQNATQLSDVAGVMEGMIRLLRGPRHTAEGACPPLVGNLVQLLEGLQAATK
jgi:hypothetical protein